ncbi:glycine betaine ABC transporter substrate-binding protein [Thermophagus xiamenensis]|uniref:Glycine betaine/proline transport system substrate-binding protein n=1 Tax=Thermophagus xiamenensis TaxID=385682 RepID=A0A1I1WRK3_9BACT|nr:glycine betaine ABC transporter substrate-binding protein [Thermophagus xiamenensis]SFD97797.1 glycine betaine/proline transport system substrate-binding protein [Thermophagus xiamenensis]
MKLKNLFFAALIVALISSCTSSQKKKGDDTKEITIAYVDGWAEGVAMTYVTKSILESEGYSVSLKNAAVDLVFASLANGDIDVFMDAWLPVTHKEKIAKFTDKIESLGTNIDEARIGLVVPSYVTINSIEELNSVADRFDGKIIGIEKGAGITAKTELAIEQYGLNFEQLNSSGVAMLTELTKAIKENRWIVVTGWAPHWKFGRYDLKFLDDPQKVYGETEHVETYARKGFKDDDPFAANYFTNFHLTDAQIADLLAKMEDSDNKETTAKAWIEQNKALVQGWLKKAE